jgi:hypothetical protein
LGVVESGEVDFCGVQGFESEERLYLKEQMEHVAHLLESMDQRDELVASDD